MGDCGPDYGYVNIVVKAWSQNNVIMQAQKAAGGYVFPVIHLYVLYNNNNP